MIGSYHVIDDEKPHLNFHNQLNPYGCMDAKWMANQIIRSAQKDPQMLLV